MNLVTVILKKKIEIFKNINFMMITKYLHLFVIFKFYSICSIIEIISYEFEFTRDNVYMTLFYLVFHFVVLVPFDFSLYIKVPKKKLFLK